MKNKLLETALNYKLKPTGKNCIYTQDEMELALAWANDEVKLTQVVAALNFKSSANSYVFLARCLKQVIKDSK